MLRCFAVILSGFLIFLYCATLSFADDYVDRIVAVVNDDAIALSELEKAGGQYFEIDDINKENPIPYDELVLQTVLLEVTQTKNIVTTALQGRNGTVKEFVSDGDFVINMIGGIIGETDENGSIQNIGNFYPEVDVKKLIEITKVPSALTITSAFLQSFGINEAVITNYTINQPEGQRNVQPFTMALLSDVPADLNELENEEAG